MARHRLISVDMGSVQIKPTYSMRNPTHKIMIYDFVERCLIQGVSTRRIASLVKKEYGIGPSKIEEIIQAIGDRWSKEEAIRRPLYKQAAMERITESLQNAYASNDTRLALSFEKLLSELQGTKAPIEISVTATVTTALANVILDMSAEDVQNALDEMRELKRLAGPTPRIIEAPQPVQSKVALPNPGLVMRLHQQEAYINPGASSRNPYLDDREALENLKRMILFKADQSRNDPAEMFSFVLREETTRKPIRVAQHQKVFLDFVMSHENSVLMLPAGHSKTFSIAGLSMYLLGKDPTLRGAIISATQGQAEKPLSMVRDYIEKSSELKLVFPDLRRSPNKGDPWTQTELTIARPPGIRDASLIALGYHGAITGARLNFVNVDDIISPENVQTKEARDQLYEWFDAAVLSRLDTKKSRIVVTNTAWHPDDLVHRLKKIGWPTLKMDIMGGIEVFNTEWDSPLIRPAHPNSFECRLSAYSDRTPLFPERFDLDVIEKLRKVHLPHRFNQLYMNVTGDSKSSRCKLEWIEKCKQKGKGLAYQATRDNNNIRITGVDIAIGQSEGNHDSCLFTIEILPSGERLILEIDVGKYDGPELVNKIISCYHRYGSFIRVENNAAQDFIRQFTLNKNIAIPVIPHTTGRNKAHPEHGLESLFVEIYNGAWVIPCDLFGRCHPNTQRFIDSCHYYNPAKHTDDVLMSAWFCKEQARKLGLSYNIK